MTSKWGVHGLARILQIEARQTPGIDVSVVSPGSVNTPAYLQAANYAGWEGRPPPPIDPPEKVARAIVRTLTSPRRDRSLPAELRYRGIEPTGHGNEFVRH